MMDLYTLLTKCKIHFDDAIVFNHPINKIAENSTNIEPNDIFVALRGENNDGHEYITYAISHGARTIIYEDKYYGMDVISKINMIRVDDSKKTLALLTNHFYDEPTKKLKLIGVTGTNGKTTVTTLIHNLHRLLNVNCTLIGTTGIKVNDSYEESNNTTPSNLILNNIFSDSLKQGIDNVVMEVSSHAIKQQRISQFSFNTVIYTNFSHDHLDYHKTFEDYFYSKGLLFASLGNFHNGKVVILNGDDKYFKQFLRLTNVEYVTYGIDVDNAFQARNIVCDINKISFDFYLYNEYLGTVNNYSLFGFYNIYNLLASLAYFYINNYDMVQVLAAVQKLIGVKGRMERVLNEYGMNVFIDFAHTPLSVYRVLYEVKMISRRNVICVLGCGGDRDHLKRPVMGKIATELAFKVIFTSDNPRNENPSAIIADIVKGAVNNNYQIIENRSEAIKLAIDCASKDDVVVILGKGHENYQIIENQKYHFSDFDEVRKSLDFRFRGTHEGDKI